MPQSVATKDLSKIVKGNARYNMRQVLRGDISDEFGEGQCIFTRHEQVGFDDEVKFVAGEHGIVAVNAVSGTLLETQDDGGCESTERHLQFRYSIIPKKGCSVDFCQ